MGRNSFSAALLFIFALALLLLPIQWIGAVILAAVFHELCHYAAVRLCGGKINGVAVGLSGAQMGVAGVSAGKELFCALAGPAGSLALLLFSLLGFCPGLEAFHLSNSSIQKLKMQDFSQNVKNKLIFC